MGCELCSENLTALLQSIDADSKAGNECTHKLLHLKQSISLPMPRQTGAHGVSPLLLWLQQLQQPRLPDAVTLIVTIST